MNRVREFRKRRKWTQAALAKHAGLSQGSIWTVENGHNVPLPGMAKKIAKALDVPQHDVFPDGVRMPCMGPRADYWTAKDREQFSGFMRGLLCHVADVHLCHWCGFPYDPEKEKPLKVRVKGRERIYGHEKCRQEHRDTERYA